MCLFSEARSRREVCVRGAEGDRGAQAAAAPPRERERPSESALCSVQQRGDHYGIITTPHRLTHLQYTPTRRLI